MSDEISIFNIGEHAAEMNAAMFAERPVSNLFDPKLKDVNETKVLIVRPIPNVLNPLNSTTTKRFYVFQDGANKLFFDSRTTFNDPAKGKYEFCPVSDLWSKLRASTDKAVNDMTAWLPLQIANYAYVQIVRYPAEQEMQGKIVPMRLPMELIKLFQSMAKPSEQELAIGKTPVQPFDIFGGCNIQLTITGKMVKDTLMRDWKCEVSGGPTNLTLPLGANGTYVPVSQLAQQQVLDYLKSAEPEVLDEVYGYHEPTAETKMRVKQFLHRTFDMVPGLQPVIEGYFPELNAQAVPGNQNAQPAPQPIGNAPEPAPVAQPAPEPAPAPQPTVISAGNPMNTAGVGTQGAAPEAPAPEPAPEPAPAPQPTPEPAPAPAPQTEPQPAPVAQPAPGPMLP